MNDRIDSAGKQRSGSQEPNEMNGEMGRQTSNNGDLSRERIVEAIGSKSGREYWRSLDELSDTPEFRERVEQEFPAGADQMLDPVTRRNFMKVMGASFALAGLSSCVNQPEEKIVPYVKQPEQLVPGNPLQFATATTLGGYATGVLVESHEGRPTRIAGNPDHPASLGATDVYTQAEILQLFDPDRERAVRHKRDVTSWQAFATFIESRLATMPDGRGLSLLLGPIGSPSLREQISGLQRQMPEMKVYTYESAPRSGGAAQRYQLSEASVVVSLGSDFLTSLPESLAYARAFGMRRDPENGAADHNRLYVAEPSPTPTGSLADHRIAVRSIDLAAVAGAIANGLGAGSSSSAGELGPAAEAFVSAAVDDLRKAGANGLVIADHTQPESVRAIADAINSSIGAVGTTVVPQDDPVARPASPADDLRRLVAEMESGNVNTLFVHGCNPLYDAPADVPFSAAFERVPNRLFLGLLTDETAWNSHWQIAETHQFETWGDGVAFDGTASITQPMIAPLYSTTKSLAQVLALFGGDSVAKDKDLVEAYWLDRLPGDAEKSWRKALHDGVVTGATVSVSSAATVTQSDSEGAAESPAVDSPTTGTTSAPVDEGGIEVNFRPDPSIFDGRYNNNGWLQELPKPMTKLVWDNAVLISPATAARLDVENGDVVRLSRNDHSVEGPIWITPGHADESVTLYLGQGREKTGRVGEGVGFNPSSIRTSDGFWSATGVTIEATGEDHELVSTQDHWSLEGRNLFRQATLAEFLANPDAVKQHDHIDNDGSLSFYSSADWSYDGYAWGMTIDLNRCTSCNACVIACQSENNIPVVGKDQVAVGREMHWIRVDRYFGGDPEQTDSVEIYAQPVPCMQCEQAPCEVVCPVAATVHSAEGLNDMVYNRCVGTRYCSNNCPYKVRRFNFLQYADESTEQFRLMRNPDVSVRTRGVMEKCTYCVQRINHARIESKIAGEQIPVDSIVTACQSACPTQAIAFGDQSNPESTVAKLKGSTRNYGMLAAELNTRPRTTYLARIRNAHESMEPASPQGEDHH